MSMTVTTRKEGRREAGLDDLPSEWSIVPSGMIIQRHRVIVGDRWSDYERLSLTLGGVVPRTDVSQGTGEPDSLSTYQILPADALVFKLIDLENVRTSRVGLSGREGIVSSAYIVADVNESVANARFMYWFFMALYLRKYFNYMGNGGVRSALNFDDLARIPVPLPPLAEQESIADYLDRETADIDSMVGDLDSFLVLLADRRRTLITDVVYGKTGPGTGEEFPLAPLGILAEFSSGTLLDVARFSKHSDLKTVVYGSNGVIGSTDQDPNVDTPTILVGRLGASGEVNHAPSSVFATDNALVLEPHQDFDLNWMYYTLTASNLGDLSTSTAQPLITASKVKQVRVPHIGLRLQREIADYLDWETGQIDLLIEDARCTRELLVERREALISDAVTGRLRVAV